MGLCILYLIYWPNHNHTFILYFWEKVKIRISASRCSNNGSHSLYKTITINEIHSRLQQKDYAFP